MAVALKEVSENGHADRAAIWAELSSLKRQQFQALLVPPLIAREFAYRIKQAIG